MLNAIILRRIKMSLFKKSQKKPMTIKRAIILALPKLPETFSGYENPFGVSLVGMVRKISNRKYVGDSTILRELRKRKSVECVDHNKGIYKQL